MPAQPTLHLADQQKRSLWPLSGVFRPTPLDDLIEQRPDPDARTDYYAFTPPDWASRWPTKALWVAHKPT
ncbi:MAG: hypothetical protein JO115_02695 [Pseudonocardiales bacterium]|nr:hypothetical protein [Pseudonocardiales bacterium]